MRKADLKIVDIAFGGKGVARQNGKVIFVPFTIDGETVSSQIIRQKKKFADAEVIEIREPSPHRVVPECPYFGRCGGCSYQHINYEHQLSIKWRQVRDVLQRIGQLTQIPIRPIISSPLAYRYRNRVTVHAQDGVIGFFGRESHRLIDVERCPISMDDVNRALAELRSERPPDGHYTLRAGTGGHRGFSQANDAVANALVELISQLIPNAQKLLIDAYCGAGFFAKRLLDKFDQVIGIDWDRFAIQAAQQNATGKETYIAGDIEDELVAVAAPLCLPRRSPAEAGRGATQGQSDSIAPALQREKTTVIVDPPATGLTPNIRRTLLEVTPGTLIYVSCNPATLARDLTELRQKFTIESVTPLDMFPQTAEIEVAVHLRASS